MKNIIIAISVITVLSAAFVSCVAAHRGSKQPSERTAQKSDVFNYEENGESSIVVSNVPELPSEKGKNKKTTKNSEKTTKHEKKKTEDKSSPDNNVAFETSSAKEKTKNTKKQSKKNIPSPHTDKKINPSAKEESEATEKSTQTATDSDGWVDKWY